MTPRGHQPPDPRPGTPIQVPVLPSTVPEAPNAEFSTQPSTPDIRTQRAELRNSALSTQHSALRTQDLALLALILAIALAVRLTFALSTPVFLEGDSQSYLLPAWELASGQGFSPELRRTPLYPLLIAASLRTLGESLDALALVQHALGLGTVALTFLIARRLFGRAAAFLAALAIALSGSQLIYERYLMTEVLFGFVLALACLAMLVALQRLRDLTPRPPSGRGKGESFSTGFAIAPPSLAGKGAGGLGPFLAAGLLIGLAALTRPVAQAILPIFLLAILLLLPRWRAALQAAGLVVVGYALLIVPWTVRNLLAHDTLSASGGLGRSLIARTVKYDTLFDWKWLSETYVGREDPASRARMLLYRKRGNIPASRSVRPYQDALIEELGVSQAQAEALMRDVALEAIARRPLDYLRGSLLFTGQLMVGQEEPLRSHWKQRANKDWAEQWDNRIDALVGPITPRQADAQPLATVLTDLYQPARIGWLIAGFFLLGCLLAWREPKRRPALVLAAVAVALLGLSAFLDGPVLRYRHPVDPLLTILAAGGLLGVLRLLVAQLRHASATGGRQEEQPAVAVR